MITQASTWLKMTITIRQSSTVPNNSIALKVSFPCFKGGNSSGLGKSMTRSSSASDVAIRMGNACRRLSSFGAFTAEEVRLSQQHKDYLPQRPAQAIRSPNAAPADPGVVQKAAGNAGLLQHAALW